MSEASWFSRWILFYFNFFMWHIGMVFFPVSRLLVLVDGCLPQGQSAVVLSLQTLQGIGRAAPRLSAEEAFSGRAMASHLAWDWKTGKKTQK